MEWWKRGKMESAQLAERRVRKFPRCEVCAIVDHALVSYKPVIGKCLLFSISSS